MVTYTLSDFIEDVLRVDRVKLNIGLSANRLVPAYTYSRTLPNNYSVAKFVEKRIRAYLPDNADIVVVDPRGAVVEDLNNTKLSSVRIC